jgi:hypothetical protein
MRDLVQKLPSSTPPPANTKNQQGIQQQHDLGGASDETIAAVLATLNEVIKKNAEFARSLLDESGVDRLVSITRQKQRYSSRVVKFASQVLAALWTHQELRDAYKKSGWKVCLLLDLFCDAVLAVISQCLCDLIGVGLCEPEQQHCVW